MDRVEQKIDRLSNNRVDDVCAERPIAEVVAIELSIDSCVVHRHSDHTH